MLVNKVTTNNYESVTGLIISKRFSIQYDNYKRISTIRISKITTRNRHISLNNSTNNYDEIGYNSTIDINSHADTHFLGENF